MTDQISGLGQDALDFLDALKANNNRDWFAENKARFEDDVKKTLNNSLQICYSFSTIGRSV